MRTEHTKTNYLQIAQELTFMMDIEEQATKAASSLWQTDEAESRLASLRSEAESLLKGWKLRAGDIVIAERKTQREYDRIAEQASKFRKYSEEFQIFAKVGKSLRESLESLQKARASLQDAIEYLHEYLYPSQEGNASQADDVPFTSNWGAVAQESRAQTPQDLAREVLGQLLEKEGRNMRLEFLSQFDEEMPAEWHINNSLGATDVWELIDNAIYRLENADVSVNQCGAEELYKQCQEYPEMSRDFQTVVDEVREYFLNA